jgi:ABC-type nitrate/sulfonate/bicarbonate transport system permease component
VAVFVFMLNARAGVLSADEEHVEALRSLGATRTQLFGKLYLPASVPTLFTAVRLGLVYALLGVISSEILASGRASDS